MLVISMRQVNNVPIQKWQQKLGQPEYLFKLRVASSSPPSLAPFHLHPPPPPLSPPCERFTQNRRMSEKGGRKRERVKLILTFFLVGSFDSVQILKSPQRMLIYINREMKYNMLYNAYLQYYAYK